MTRAAGSQTLQDFSSRQLGYCVASVLPALTCTRVMELGGELETCQELSLQDGMTLRVRHCTFVALGGLH